MNKICCIFNLAALYRAPIYKLMDEQLKCDFYLGDKTQSSMKLMDYNSLKGFQETLGYKPLIGRLIWREGVHKVMKSQYKTYIMTADPFCLSDWVVILYAKLTGKKVVAWAHGWYGDENAAKKIIKKCLYCMCYKVMLYGDYARNLMIENGFKPDKLVCIYNSLDYDKQIEVRRGLCKTNVYIEHFGNNNPVLLYIGRLQKVKRLDMIIDAMNVLKKRGVNLNFVYIGKDIENICLEKHAEQYGFRDNIWAYGPLYEEERKGEMMYNAEVCVSPGNVGLTAMDCLTYGLPVITHNNFLDQCPEFEAIHDGKTGLFFKQNDVNNLTDKIEQWLTYSSSHSREEIAKDCFSIIDEKYNPHRQIETMKGITNSID